MAHLCQSLLQRIQKQWRREGGREEGKKERKEGWASMSNRTDENSGILRKWRHLKT